MRMFAEKLKSEKTSPQRPSPMVLPLKTYEDAGTSPVQGYRGELQQLESMYREEVDNVCWCV